MKHTLKGVTCHFVRFSVMFCVVRSEACAHTPWWYWQSVNSWCGSKHILTDNILWPHAYNVSPVRINLSGDRTWHNIWRSPQCTVILLILRTETKFQACVTSSRDQCGDIQPPWWFGRLWYFMQAINRLKKILTLLLFHIKSCATRNKDGCIGCTQSLNHSFKNELS